jgi:carbonic anhydrase/acetyltransferase-like protein (isoleucine patch superfamily)
MILGRAGVVDPENDVQGGSVDPEGGAMRVQRNDDVPRIDPEARVAASAVLVGNVEVARGAYIDHGVVVESGGPPIRIGEDTAVLAGTVIRSVGGSTRPPSAVDIGARTIISPTCVLTGCRIGANCYVATGAIVLQQAIIGDDVRLGAASVTHATTVVPAGERVGMREIAVATPQGFVSTSDVAEHAGSSPTSGSSMRRLASEPPSRPRSTRGLSPRSSRRRGRGRTSRSRETARRPRQGSNYREAA